MVNLMGDLLKTVLFMEIMVMGDGWIISVQEDWLQSVNQHTTTYDLSFKIKIPTCFCLVSFFGRMFLYYQGQIHTSNLNFGAKNRFLAPRCATILFSRRKENREKSIFEPILNIVKMSHTYHMKKYNPVLLCQYKVRVKICPNIHTDLMLNSFETINS